jgi:hypothetical protein
VRETVQQRFTRETESKRTKLVSLGEFYATGEEIRIICERDSEIKMEGIAEMVSGWKALKKRREFVQSFENRHGEYLGGKLRELVAKKFFAKSSSRPA